MTRSSSWIEEIHLTKARQWKIFSFNDLFLKKNHNLSSPLQSCSSAIGWLIPSTRNSRISSIYIVFHECWGCVCVAVSQSSTDIYMILLQIYFQILSNQKGPHPACLQPVRVNHVSPQFKITNNLIYSVKPLFFRKKSQVRSRTALGQCNTQSQCRPQSLN